MPVPFLKPQEEPEELEDQIIVPAKKSSCLVPVISILALAAIASAWFYRVELGIPYLSKTNHSQPVDAKPDSQKYSFLKTQLAEKRTTLADQYHAAQTQLERDKIINESSRVLEDYLPQMMRCWLGHPWDFNGTAETPGKGKIACGYYVSTILRDSGFKINRITTAQQASQNIIKTFLPNGPMKVKTRTSYDDYANMVEKSYEGINIVGLDRHVAFIVVKKGDLRFIHSSGGAPKCVVDESRKDAYVLSRSRYRVIGNLTRNRPLLIDWLNQKTLPTAR